MLHFYVFHWSHYYQLWHFSPKATQSCFNVNNLETEEFSTAITYVMYGNIDVEVNNYIHEYCLLCMHFSVMIWHFVVCVFNVLLFSTDDAMMHSTLSLVVISIVLVYLCLLAFLCLISRSVSQGAFLCISFLDSEAAAVSRRALPPPFAPRRQQAVTPVGDSALNGSVCLLGPGSVNVWSPQRARVSLTYPPHYSATWFLYALLENRSVHILGISAWRRSRWEAECDLRAIRAQRWSVWGCNWSACCNKDWGRFKWKSQLECLHWRAPGTFYFFVLVSAVTQRSPFSLCCNHIPLFLISPTQILQRGKALIFTTE